MKDTWYDMGYDADMSWMYNWKGKEKKMAISESKKKIVIDNYFKKECDVNTSIKEAFIKGFELGLKKAPQPKMGYWITLKDEYGDVHEAVCSNCDANGNHKWKYCPECGAKMQEVEK